MEASRDRAGFAGIRVGNVGGHGGFSTTVWPGASLSTSSRRGKPALPSHSQCSGTLDGLYGRSAATKCGAQPNPRAYRYCGGLTRPGNIGRLSARKVQ
jgi:hypothetical protein